MQIVQLVHLNGTGKDIEFFQCPNKAINGASLPSVAPLDPNTPFNFLLSLRAIVAKNRTTHWGPLWQR